MYGSASAGVRELFADFLSGALDGSALVVSAAPLSDNAAYAIDRSLEALGYGARAYTCATLSPIDAIDANSLFMLVEGLDPFCVIITDSTAAAHMGKAFHTNFALNASVRVFGRPAVAFSDFESLLVTPEGKQRAWALLKTLPHLNG